MKILSVSWKWCQSFDIIAKVVSPSICTHPHFFALAEESKILNQFHISNSKSYKALYPFENKALTASIIIKKYKLKQSEASFIHLLKLVKREKFDN